MVARKANEMSNLFSIYTPTHNPEWIQRCYSSLLAQTYKNWEWIIVPNGPLAGLIGQKIREVMLDDERIKIYPYKLTHSVGMLKNYACSKAIGDIFVELDHDDELTPNCLEEINKADNGQPSFFYSDWTGIRNDGTYETFSPAFGWETYFWDYKGAEVPAVRAFEPSARSICEIYWAPNHVRAWTRSAYEACGGYDPSLTVADDHDIVCRTYLTDVRFVHLDKPLYIYYIHDNNTVKLLNADIQTQQAKNRNKYIVPLAEAECRRNGTELIKLNEDDVPGLGFRGDRQISSPTRQRLALAKESSVGCIQAFDFLQLLPKSHVINFMEEVYRALIPGGWFISVTPSIEGPKGEFGRGAIQDLRHQSFWCKNTFWYWTQEDRAKYYYPDNESKHRMPKFQEVRSYIEYPTPWHETEHIPYLYVDLIALKGQKTPGLQLIK